MGEALAVQPRRGQPRVDSRKLLNSKCNTDYMSSAIKCFLFYHFPGAQPFLDSVRRPAFCFCPFSPSRCLWLVLAEGGAAMAPATNQSGHQGTGSILRRQIASGVADKGSWPVQRLLAFRGYLAGLSRFALSCVALRWLLPLFVSVAAQPTLFLLGAAILCYMLYI